MSSQLSEFTVSAAFIAKCSHCKVRSELEVCVVCDEAKCKQCAAQHLMEAEELWDPIEDALTEISHKQRKLTIQNKNCIDSLAASLNQLCKTYEGMLNRLKKAYDADVKQINDLEKIYKKQNQRLAIEWNSLETNEVYKKWIESDHRCLPIDDTTELEKVIERIQYYFREESTDDDDAGKQFEFESNNQILQIGKLSAIVKETADYGAAPRRLKLSVRRRYSDIEERIARITDSKRKHEELLSAINGPLATRESRMEAVAWIAVCQFNCRIFGGFVRDWIVGGYSSRPSTDTDSSMWITYSHSRDDKNGDQQVPHLHKEFVPNDIDCYLEDNDFDIDQFLEYLRKYEIECKVSSKIWRGYVLLMDEDRSPFTMDLLTADSALKFHKYRILDLDVNNLFVEKDYRRALGLRTDLICSKKKYLFDLEAIVENIKNKCFTVLRDVDIEDRIEKLTNRGWTRVIEETEDEAEYSDNNSSDGYDCDFPDRYWCAYNPLAGRRGGKLWQLPHQKFFSN